MAPFSNVDSPLDLQQAFATKMLVIDLQLLAKDLGEITTHMGDLIEGGSFFPMQACKFA